LRRPLVLAAAAAALLATGSAPAALRPVERTFGEVTVPRVRTGTVRAPAGHERADVRVIATLRLPPLAAAFDRRLYARAAGTRLNATSTSSRAYLARVARAQRQAVARLRAEIPEARVSRRFSIVLDGLTVTLPAKRLPSLLRLGFARVYPTYRYTRSLDESPSIIGAPQLEAATGASGAGVKIGVVDDGIDQTNPFLAASGLGFPVGFPKGDRSFTTPKVIVARSFPGPGSGKRGKLPLDRDASFHGTHVSGIAAGDAGTSATAGRDHPAVAGLSGIAPRAWLGNYRVFNVPTPLGGEIAETPEIVAAFEAAVADGMDVLNFSGGGAQTDPANDALVETVANVAAAGVVPVIAAGNDRDDFGLGTVGSPGTAPDAISVAAVSNNHVFGRVLQVSAPGLPGPPIPFVNGQNAVPAAWLSSDQKVVDVTTITGTDGKPVDRLLCGPPGAPEQLTSKLPPGSLSGAIVLASRGVCTFVSKATRAKAAGAIGLILGDNRPGDANAIPVRMPIPGGMIADLDAARLRSVMASTGGTAAVRVGAAPVEIDTARGGVPASFSSGGPTPFGHELKPDVAAPGSQVLSSTLREYAGSQFAVFDGTSMATPHVAGAAALLRELHPLWSPAQVKSALMSTAGPAFSDTGRSREAPVLLEGAGLAQLTAANDPRIFTAPQSLSFSYLDVTRGAASKPLLLAIDDAGGGAGTWQVTVVPQAASDGASLDVPATVTLAPGGQTYLPAVARALAEASPGDDYGHVVLTQGTVTRRVPYYFSVVKPALVGSPVVPLRRDQRGETSSGIDRARVYRWPAAPFGPSIVYAGSPGVDEPGAERVYSYDVRRPVVNFGVVAAPRTRGSLVDPWVLGSLDENDVQGFAGTPVNVNSLTFGYRAAVGAAGAGFPRQKRYYVVVDSPRDDGTRKVLGGRYELHSWVDDLDPPRLTLVTRRVAAGRPTLVLRATDRGAGVDPVSLVISYGNSLVGASAYDPDTGIAVFALPAAAQRLSVGRTSALLIASDYQEAKNVATLPGPDTMPNTAFRRTRIAVVDGPTLALLTPLASRCVAGSQRLLAVGSSTRRLRSVTFYDGDRRIASQRRQTAGVFSTTWRTGRLAKGSRHELRAVLHDAAGRTATASRTVRVCGS
jgi:minor extracellular serine protease Vpr